jgi:PAS domain S-box-containing protein
MEAIREFEKLHKHALDFSILEILIDTLPDGVFTINNAAQIILWNKAMERITGYTSDEVIGKRPSLLSFQYRNGEVCPNHVSKCGLFEKGEINHMDCMLRHKGGWFVPCMKNARVIQDKRGRIIGAVETVTDLTAVRNIQKQAETAHKRLYHSLGNIVGDSQPMRKIYEAISHAASSNATVLVQGDSGTGKELVAGAIHYQSARANKPLVIVNCSALPDTLLENELFGHIKGAFTGAIKDRTGRFEEAHGGTIFLDEIGDISPIIQVKLLRVLQEHVIERIGESRPRKIDIRIIAATNRDLTQLVANGAFREDLYYRLKVFTITMPPLHERKSDIPGLVEHFIKRFNRETGRSISGITDDAMRLLLDYRWPGNVRELENAIEHAFVVCSGDCIQVFDLPVEVRRQSCEPVAQPGASKCESLTRDALLDLLQECGWNKSEAARRLGCSHTAVWKHMKKWDIPLKQK